MLRFRERNSKRKVLCCKKKPKNIWDVNVDNIVISKLVKAKTNSKYCIGYLDKAIRPLVFIMPKMCGYVKTFKVKEGDKDKSNKLMSFRIDDEKLLEKCKAICIELNALPVYDDKYIETKLRTYGDKV